MNTTPDAAAGRLVHATVDAPDFKTGNTGTSIMLPWLISVLTAASYLFLYTAYDKQSKQLSRDLLVAVLTNRKGNRLVELNKLISLVGITLLCIAALLPSASHALNMQLLYHAIALLWIHSAYSLWKYYGDKNQIPSISLLLNPNFAAISTASNDRTVILRTLSVWLGSLGQVLVSLTMSPLGIVAAMAHFWTMEINYKWQLQVRPWAFLPFVLFGVWIVKMATAWW